MENLQDKIRNVLSQFDEDSYNYATEVAALCITAIAIELGGGKLYQLLDGVLPVLQEVASSSKLSKQLLPDTVKPKQFKQDVQNLALYVLRLEYTKLYYVSKQLDQLKRQVSTSSAMFASEVGVSDDIDSRIIKTRQRIKQITTQWTSLTAEKLTLVVPDEK